MAKAFVEGLGWVEKQTAVVEIDDPGTYSITPDRGKVFDAIRVTVNVDPDDYVKKTEFDALAARVEALEETLLVINFTVEGWGEFKAKDGMTWAEWCENPKYNTCDWVVSDYSNTVYTGFGTIAYNLSYVSANEPIIANRHYDVLY